MAKKVLIISTSLRGGSNSDILARECERGAKEVGHEVEYISLKGKEIKYCIGCLACQTKGVCVLKDDVAEIMAKVKDAEVLVFATPIYYYEMAGQMKTLLDRLNPLFPSDYLFRDIYNLFGCYKAYTFSVLIQDNRYLCFIHSIVNLTNKNNLFYEMSAPNI